MLFPRDEAVSARVCNCLAGGVKARGIEVRDLTRVGGIDVREDVWVEMMMAWMCFSAQTCQ